MNPAALAVHGLWRCSAAPAARRFQAAMKNPERIQQDLLAGILCRNAATSFGRSHGFAKIHNAGEYQRAVPPRDYADFQPWLDAAADGSPDQLTPGRPRAFLPTSGTSTGAKLIPWTPALQCEFNAALGPWVHGFMRSHPTAWRGSAYWSLSPPVWPSDRTTGGIPIGFESDTSYLPAILRPLLGATFAVPAAVAEFREPDVWRYATLLHLLSAADLSLVSVWSPTFLISLLEPLADWWSLLLTDLARGTFNPPTSSGAAIGSVPGKRHGDRRAMALRAMSAGGKVPEPAQIWPHLVAISCWADAAALAPAQRLATLFPHARVVGKGLIATEGVVSIPWPDTAAPALALTSHFYEFVDEAGNAHPAWDLRQGDCYSVLLTTGGGLYRYRLHDQVRVVGFHEQCPLLEFIGRDGITCDLCGEKLAEPFVRDCLARLSPGLGQAWTFALLAPTGNDAESPGYTLFITSDTHVDGLAAAAALDTALSANVHYHHARRIGQLAAPAVVQLSNTADWAWARFETRMAERGLRLGEIKPAALDARPGWELVFECGGKSITMTP